MPVLVRDLMRIGVPTCAADTPVIRVVNRLRTEDLESLVVLDKQGHAVGVFGRQEVVALYARPDYVPDELPALVVGQHLRKDIPTIPPDIPAAAAAQLMLDQGERALYLLHHDGGLRWPAAVLDFKQLIDQFLNT